MFIHPSLGVAPRGHTRGGSTTAPVPVPVARTLHPSVRALKGTFSAGALHPESAFGPIPSESPSALCSWGALAPASAQRAPSGFSFAFGPSSREFLLRFVPGARLLPALSEPLWRLVASLVPLPLSLRRPPTPGSLSRPDSSLPCADHSSDDPFALEMPPKKCVCVCVCVSVALAQG